MGNLLNSIKKLANEKPEFRNHLVPILKQAVSVTKVADLIKNINSMLKDNYFVRIVLNNAAKKEWNLYIESLDKNKYTIQTSVFTVKSEEVEDTIEKLFSIAKQKGWLKEKHKNLKKDGLIFLIVDFIYNLNQKG